MGNVFSNCSNLSVVRPDDAVPNLNSQSNKELLSTSLADLNILIRSIGIEQEQWVYERPSSVFTLDSTNFIVGDLNGYISIFQTAFRVVPERFKIVNCKGISSVKISFDGSFILVGTTDGYVIILNLADGLRSEVARFLISLNSPIVDACLSTDQLLLCAVAENGTLKLIFIKQMKTVYTKQLANVSLKKTRISFNPDSTTIYIGNASQPLVEIDLSAMKEKIISLFGIEHTVYFPIYTPAEEIITIGKTESLLMNINTRQFKGTFHSEYALDAEHKIFCPESRTVSEIHDNMLIITPLQAAHQEEPHKLFLDSQACSLQISSKGEYHVIFQEKDGFLLPLLYEKRYNRLSYLHKISMKFKSTICFSSDSNYLIGVNEKDLFVKIDVQTGLVAEELGKFSEYAVKFLGSEKTCEHYPDGLRFLAKSNYHYYILALEGRNTWVEYRISYQAPSPKEIPMGSEFFIKIFVKTQSKIYGYDLKKPKPWFFPIQNAIAVKGDPKKKLAVVLTDQELIVVSLLKKRILKILKKPHSKFELDAFVVRKKKMLIVGSVPSEKSYVDRKIHLIDVVDRKNTILLLAVSHENIGDNLNLLCCLVAFGGSLLIYCLDNGRGTIVFISTHSLRVIKFIEMGSEVATVVISPDSRHLAVLLKNGTINIIDILEFKLKSLKN